MLKSSFAASSPTRRVPTPSSAQGHEIAIGWTCAVAVVRYVDGETNVFQPNRLAKIRTSAGAATTSLEPFTGSSAPGTESTPATGKVQPAQDPLQSFDDAYWAAQPAAVQQLRTIDDQGQRTTMATQLATQGYKIDVPIMVWGWDPSQVTSLRQSYGYTWVPSALQNPVPVAPGLAQPGMQSYDPNNPPAGSITV